MNVHDRLSPVLKQARPLAADLARSHAALLKDDLARVAPPDYDVRPSFEDLSRRQQLEIAETVCQRPAYLDALGEALPESEG